MMRARNVVGLTLILLAVAGAAVFYHLRHRGPVVDERAPIRNCAELLRPEVERLLLPVLRAHRRDDWAPNFEALERLLRSTNAVALEARVALMAYYIGEHPGEELLESVLAEQERATPLVKRYSQCRPPLVSERQIGTVLVLRTLYDAYFRHARELGGAGAAPPPLNHVPNKRSPKSPRPGRMYFRSFRARSTVAV